MDEKDLINKELAAAQLQAMEPLIRLSRRAFAALNLLPPMTVGSIEAVAWQTSLAVVRSALLLEQELKKVILGQ